MTRLPNASVYLVPVGRSRYELYTEPADDEEPQEPPTGFFGQRLHRMRELWHEAVEKARRSDDVGRWAQFRNWAVCRASETIAEQRTLWSLRNVETACLSYPSDLTESETTNIRGRLLADARRHHGKWLSIDGLLFVASGALMLVPGPNVLAYYFGLRLVGHYLSWQGARHGMDETTWQTRAEPALTELGTLAGVPRESRSPRVHAIATGLNLPRLAAFFDRVAV